MEHLIIIASLGRVRVLQSAIGEIPAGHAHLTESPNSSIRIHHKKRGAIVTDQSGRFRQGNAPSPQTNQHVGMSYGEAHNLQSELDKQALREVAQTIIGVLKQEDYPQWRLIFPRTHLTELLRSLPLIVLDCLTQRTGGDWTKLPTAEIEKRLLHPAA